MNMFDPCASAWARFHTTPSLTQPPTAPESSVPALHLLPIAVHFPRFPCAGTVWPHADTLPRQVTAAPGQELVPVTLPWSAWWDTWAGSARPAAWQQLATRGSSDWCRPLLPPPSAALPSPSCWCQCSWSYAGGQVRNLTQLKADVTIKQKNKHRYAAMGIVPSPGSACSLQTPLLALGGQRRAGKQGRMSIYTVVSLQGLKNRNFFHLLLLTFGKL